MRIGALLFVGLLLPSFSKGQSYFESTKCAQGVREVQLRHKTSFQVPVKALSPGPEKDLARYAQLHSRYFLSSWMNQIDEGKAPVQWMLPLAPQAEVEVLGKTKALFGKNLKLRRPIQNGIDPLMAEGGRFDEILAEDEVLKVDYEMRLTALACGFNDRKVIQAIVPVDPLLIFHQSSPKGAWLDVPSVGKEVHPCASKAQAYTVLPDKMWYLWKPDATYVNSQGKTVRCMDGISIGKEVRLEEVRFSESAGTIPGPDRSSFFSNVVTRDSARPLRASILVGTLLESPSAESLKHINQLFGQGETLSARLTKMSHGIRKSKFKYDVTIHALLRALNDVSELVKVNDLQFNPHLDHFEVKIDGIARSNRQALSLSLYWGPTGFELGASAPHWPFLLTAYESSDILIYSGHSGMGENLSFLNAKLHGSSKLEKPVASGIKRRPMAIAVNSCRTLPYLWAQERELAKGGAADRWILAPLRSVYFVSFPTLALLYFIDQSRGGDPAELSARYIRGEPLIFAGLSGGRNRKASR